MYECQCECGEKAYWPEKYLAHDRVKSCGCLSMARRRAGKINKDKKDQIKKIRRRIRSLHKEQAIARMDGTLDKRSDIAENLRKAFSELGELGYSK